MYYTITGVLFLFLVPCVRPTADSQRLIWLQQTVKKLNSELSHLQAKQTTLLSRLQECEAQNTEESDLVHKDSGSGAPVPAATDLVDTDSGPGAPVGSGELDKLTQEDGNRGKTFFDDDHTEEQMQMKKAIAELQEKVAKINSHRPEVSFAAHCIHPTHGKRVKQPAKNSFVYHYTTINQGGHYNKTTGHYTCPVTGLYFFSFSIFGSSLSSAILKKGDKDYYHEVLMHGSSSSSFMTLSNSGVVPCAAGENVYVYSIHGATILNWGGLNRFSGFLISERQ